jgi:hypothetical protein
MLFEPIELETPPLSGRNIVRGLSACGTVTCDIYFIPVGGSERESEREQLSNSK